MPSTKSLEVSDFKDIQAGPVAPVPTRFTAFLFFAIKNVEAFRDGFRQEVLPHITTSDAARRMRDEVRRARLRSTMATVVAINVSFSHKRLSKLIPNADPNDVPFMEGQLHKAKSLGDSTGDWLHAFKEEPIHGLFEVTGYPEKSVKAAAQEKIKNALGKGAISVVFKHYGQARPGEEKGHEDFGFDNGISQPFVKFADDDKQVPKREHFPGQTVVNPGILILGQPGDTRIRPAWANNESIIAYRHLKQLVPEFNTFLKDTVLKSIFDPPHPTENTDELQKRINFLGARLMGSWKSGFPVVLSPMTDGKIPEDNPVVGKDPKRNNNFDYGPREQNPRQSSSFAHLLVTHGARNSVRCELHPDETDKTLHERGLSFLSLSSAKSPGVTPRLGHSLRITEELNPIIGQIQGKPRTMTGYDAENLVKPLMIPKQFVISQGGQYFFLPSITTLNQIANKTDIVDC